MTHPPVNEYRGMSASNQHLKGLIEQVKNKGTYCSDALDSWSTNLRIADQFSSLRTDNKHPNSVVFKTVNKNGAPIRPFQQYPPKMKFLPPLGLLTNSRVTLLWNMRGRTVHIFEVEES